MFQFAPMALGALTGALTNKDPLTGALTGGVMGAATGGLGGLGGAAQTAGNAAGGLGMSAGAGSNLAAMGGGQGLLASAGSPGMSMATGMGTQLSAAGTSAPGAMGGLLSKDNIQTAGNLAGLAAQAGVFDDDPGAPAPQSAGIPARQADFSGLLSAGRANNASGAQKMAQMRQIRRGGR